MLVDGGYCNNLPSDVMSSVFHPKVIITVNVEGYPEDDHFQINDTQSGWTLFFKGLFPRLFGEQISKNGIQQKLLYTWSENRRADNLLENSDVVIRPPLHDVKLTENNRYEEIEERGYREGRQRLMEWLRLIPEQSFCYLTRFNVEHCIMHFSLYPSTLSQNDMLLLCAHLLTIGLFVEHFFSPPFSFSWLLLLTRSGVESLSRVRLTKRTVCMDLKTWR